MKKIYLLFVFSIFFSAFSFGQKSNKLEGSGPNYYEGLADKMTPMLLKSAAIISEETALANDALVYVDFAHTNDGVVNGLTALGYTTTIASSWTDFNTKLASGNFTLAVAFAQNMPASTSGFDITVAQNFIDAGGNMIFATWTTVDTAIANLFGASFSGNNNLTTVTITDANLSAGITNPFALTNASWGTFSMGLNALEGSEVLATFENGDAAIVRANGGKTIMLGYLSDTPALAERQSIFENLVVVLDKIASKIVVNAGSNQIVDEGALVTLDGSNSYDSFGKPLTYIWKAPEGITLSNTTTVSPTFIAPQVDKETKYVFLLYVNNGKTNSVYDQVIITVKNVNHPPIANAGTNQTVNEGATVFLNGTLSTDPDSNVLNYEWTALDGIVLTGANTATPSFTTSEVSSDEAYTFTLMISDGTLTSTAQVTVTVKQVNKAPTANAGVTQTVNENVTVTLVGTASTDGDGDVLTYEWTAPNGITLSGTTTATPTFVAPEVKTDTTYPFTLTVSDGQASSTAQVTIVVKQVNKAPVANAGVAQTVKEGAIVTLNGTASTDPDGDVLLYKWTAPAGITLSATTTANPTFVAPATTTSATYTFGLIVNDGKEDSQQSSVTITVTHIITSNVQLSELSLKVYPNPFSGSVTIDLGKTLDFSSQLSIYSASGSLLLQQKLNDTSTSIDLSSLVPGSYLVKVLNNNEIKTIKLIKR